jgi:dolichyl-phosphate beta-glucosyltransferase
MFNIDSDSVLLSIVIPAYNEEQRLPKMLDAALATLKEAHLVILSKLQKRTGTSYTTIEWIVVSDGSTDETLSVVETYGKQFSGSSQFLPFIWKLIILHPNSGKGAAVRAGMLAAKGSMRLMVDADGATDFRALETLLDYKGGQGNMKHDPSTYPEIIFGSRAHLASQTQRSFIRNFLMHAFHFSVRFLVGSSVQDTQCGFKLFTQNAAELLFSNLKLQRWAFDIELVVVATKYLEMEIGEVGVPWTEVEGSKLDSSKLQLAIAALGMLRDMLCVRLCYTLGIWKIVKQDSGKKRW